MYISTIMISGARKHTRYKTRTRLLMTLSTLYNIKCTIKNEKYCETSNIYSSCTSAPVYLYAIRTQYRPCNSNYLFREHIFYCLNFFYFIYYFN